MMLTVDPWCHGGCVADEEEAGDEAHVRPRPAQPKSTTAEHIWHLIPRRARRLRCVSINPRLPASLQANRVHLVIPSIWEWGKKHKKSETSCILIMAVNINRTNLSRRIMFLNNGQQLDRAKSSRLEKFTGGNLFAKTMEDQIIYQKPRASEKLQRG
jgi:hypothetical protein